MPDEVYSMIVGTTWIFLLVPGGFGLMVAAWLQWRENSRRALVDEPVDQGLRHPQCGCLSSAVPLAIIGFLWVSVAVNIPGRDWRTGLLLAAPSVAAVVVAVRDLQAAQRAGAPRSWGLLALGIATVALLWSIGWVLGATWP